MIQPHTKAKEIVEEMRRWQFQAAPIQQQFFAKQSAKVAIDEIIKNGKLINPLLFSSQEHGEKFWQQVKNEVENIPD